MITKYSANELANATGANRSNIKRYVRRSNRHTVKQALRAYRR